MELLFAKLEIFGVIESQLAKARNAAKGMPETVLKSTDDEAILSRLIAEYSLSIPQVQWDQATVSRNEAQVDAMNMPGTMAYYERRSFMIPGEKVTVSVPYTGETDFFRVRPSSFTLNPPRARLTRDAIHFDYAGTQVDVDNAKREYETTKSEITRNLSLLASDLVRFDQTVSPALKQILQEKRERMNKGESALAAFGLPIKQE